MPLEVLLYDDEFLLDDSNDLILYEDVADLSCCCEYPVDCCSILPNELRVFLSTVPGDCPLIDGHEEDINDWPITRIGATNKWVGSIVFGDHTLTLTFCCGTNDVETCGYGYTLGLSFDPDCSSSTPECDAEGHISHVPPEEFQCLCFQAEGGFEARFSAEFTPICCGGVGGVSTLEISIID